MKFWSTLRSSHTRFPAHSISHFYDYDGNVAACGITFVPDWRTEYVSHDDRARDMDFQMVEKCQSCKLLEIMEELAK